MKINFAYRTFVWNSEAKERAAVHCVIIGFGFKNRVNKVLFEEARPFYVDKINGYLVNADNIFIKLRGKAKPGLPKLTQGSKPWDGGYLILSSDERSELIEKYPQVSLFIKNISVHMSLLIIK